MREAISREIGIVIRLPADGSIGGRLEAVVNSRVEILNGLRDCRDVFLEGFCARGARRLFRSEKRVFDGSNFGLAFYFDATF